MADSVSPEEWAKVQEALGSLITSKTRADGKNWKDAFSNMPVYLQRLGMDDINRLNILHVAGTKGKGSTCTFISSILQKSGARVGLFTSPHLCDVRERIRIDGRLISKEKFTAAFWSCFNRLKDASTADVGMPAYFRFLALLAFQIFAEERVDVAVLEVGLGGRLDATNVFARPVATCVTRLDYDHMELLGDTLTLIAREKAGIFRPGVPALTCPQQPEALASLQQVAAKVGTNLVEVAPLETFECDGPSALGLEGDFQRVNAALAVAMCREWDAHLSRGSSPLAAAAAERLALLSARKLPRSYADGLAACSFPGRAQTVHISAAELPGEGLADGMRGSEGGTEGDGNVVTFFLDGAHTPESALACASWFVRASPQCAAASDAANASGGGPLPVERVLLFNCGQDRSAEAILEPLARTFAGGACPIGFALFVPPQSSYAAVQPDAAPHGDVSWQQSNQRVWERLYGGGGTPPAAAAKPGSPGARPGAAVLSAHLGGHEGLRSAVHPSLQGALHAVKRCAQALPRMRLHVLVTGSLHLVGDTLRLLGKAAE